MGFHDICAVSGGWMLALVAYVNNIQQVTRRRVYNGGSRHGSVPCYDQYMYAGGLACYYVSRYGGREWRCEVGLGRYRS